MKGVKFFFSILLLSTASFAFAQPQETPPVQFNKLSQNLYEVLGGAGARGGAYIGDDAVLLIDSKMDQKSVEQVHTELKKLTDKPVKFLVNTHADGDHVRGNRYQPETAVIIAHENCRKEFFIPGRDGKPSEWNDPGLLRFTPSVTFQDETTVYLGTKKVELRYFGVGHTTGDAVVYFPEEKTAFVGDQIFIGRPQLIHAYKGGNSFGHVQVLEKMLAALDAQKFCSGHSDPVDRATVERHIQQIKAMQDKVGMLVKKNISADEIKKAFEPNEGNLVETIVNEITSGR